MKIFRFRVLIDSEDGEVFRDIDIQDNQTLEDLHNSIQLAFEFDNSQMASFYLSDEEWVKGDEITLFDMNEASSKEELAVMENVKLAELVEEEKLKMIYVFDFMNIWTFYVDISQVLTPSGKVKYPAVVNFVGEAPQQYASGEGPILKNEPFLGENPYTDDSFGDYEDYNEF